MGGRSLDFSFDTIYSLKTKYSKKRKTKRMASNYDTVKFEVLSGKAYYTFVHQPDRGNEAENIGPSYKIELVLDEESLKAAKEQKLKIKKGNDKIPGDYVTIRSKVDPKYPDRKPPKVMDAKRNTIPKEILVGNGSDVRVRYLPYSYGNGKISPIFKELQVINLVPYVPTEREVERKGTFLGEVEGGFTVDPKI